MEVHHDMKPRRDDMDALIFLALLLGLIAFDLLAMRFGADSRDLVNTRSFLTTDERLESNHASS